MTHTYSRGCFKLIFRKCLYLPPPHTHPRPSVPQAQAGAPTHERSLSAIARASRAFASSNDTTTLAPLLLFIPLPGLGYFSSPLSSYPFSSASSLLFHLFFSLHPLSRFALAFSFSSLSFPYSSSFFSLLFYTFHFLLTLLLQVLFLLSCIFFFHFPLVLPSLFLIS